MMKDRLLVLRNLSSSSGTSYAYHSCQVQQENDKTKFKAASEDYKIIHFSHFTAIKINNSQKLGI
jgi:hypothetical protein